VATLRGSARHGALFPHAKGDEDVMTGDCHITNIW